MPDAIGALTQPQQLGLHGSVDNAMSALGGMDSEGFLNLLVAQLKYQSPMDPQDPGDLMTQTAALAQLDASQQLLQVEQRSLGLQQAVAATKLLGTEVTGIGPDGDPVSGTVDAVRYTAAGPALSVGGVEVGFGALTEVRHGTTTPAPAPEAVPGGDGATAVEHPEMWEGPLHADDPVAAPTPEVDADPDPTPVSDEPEAPVAAPVDDPETT